MISYREKLKFLILRERLSLGWKISLLLVCGALLYASGVLMRISIQTVEIPGTVLTHESKLNQTSSETYLIARLDSGETVRARVIGDLDYKPGRRVILKEVTTNFFGYKKYEFLSYIEPALNNPASDGRQSDGQNRH